MRSLLDIPMLCIGHLTGRSVTIAARLASLAPSDVGLCSVVKAELLHGARKSARADANPERLALFFEPFASLPFDDQASEQYGIVRSTLEKQGTPIGPNDLMIAAIALASDVTLVTANRTEFERIPNLRVETW